MKGFADTLNELKKQKDNFMLVKKWILEEHEKTDKTTVTNIKVEKLTKLQDNVIKLCDLFTQNATDH
jgi:hypothetical protein